MDNRARRHCGQDFLQGPGAGTAHRGLIAIWTRRLYRWAQCAGDPRCRWKGPDYREGGPSRGADVLICLIDCG
jgi:hypothetical protein